jgi:hypothetical protein
VSGDSGLHNDRDATTLDTKAVQSLADDPDDFLGQLQVLAADDGGDPTQAIIMVDGFENPSAFPAKNSVASIRIKPDLFLDKYQRPPFLVGSLKLPPSRGPTRSTVHSSLTFPGVDMGLRPTHMDENRVDPAGVDFRRSPSRNSSK